MKTQVLVVTSAENRRLDFLKLYSMDYHVHWVKDLAETSNALLRRQFDALLIDLASEHESAVKFCFAIKRRYPAMKIVFFNAEGASLPSNFCADLVFEHQVAEAHILEHLAPLLGRSA